MKYLDFHKYLKGMKKQVLLLNQDNTPLNIITVSKAYKLLSRDKVWGDDSDECYEVVSVSKIVKIPKVLILKYYNLECSILIIFVLRFILHSLCIPINNC